MEERLGALKQGLQRFVKNEYNSSREAKMELLRLVILGARVGPTTNAILVLTVIAASSMISQLVAHGKPDGFHTSYAMPYPAPQCLCIRRTSNESRQMIFH